MPDIVLIWAAIIAFSVLAYVMLDGFDLGLGLLFFVTPREDERRLMLASIAPVWDGNGTWLVMGGGGLLAAFPLAYAVVMQALYMPILAMLMALIFPISPLSSLPYLGKAFVVCVLGGLGSVPGAVLGGLVLGLVESFGAMAIGPEHAVTLSFALLIGFLIFRPQGLLGKRGFE